MAVIYALLRVRLNNVQNVFVHQKINHRRNRHYFSANGPFLLLPLALKWGLFGTFGVLAFLFTPLMITPKTVVAAEMPYITLTVPSSPLDLTVSPDNTLTETSSTDSAKITVSSNTYWGYTLSLAGGTDDGSLTGADNNKLATLSDSGTIATNTWGYKFKKQNAPNPGDDKWLPGPKKDVLSVLDTTAGNGNGTNKAEQSIYEFTLGAKVDTNQPSGQYSNTFTFTATVNAVSYTINFEMNSGSDEPQTMTGQTQENAVALSPKEPTKADNIFMGWCDQPTTDKNCTGTRYQPGDEITVSRSNSDLTLYAIWHDDKMQNFDACEYLPKNKQIELVDTRDNRMYYVARLADDNCWMTENLDLFIDKDTTYTVADTDLDHATAEEIAECQKNSSDCVDEDGHYQWKPDKSTYTDATWNSIWLNDVSITQSYEPGNYCWNGKRSASSSDTGSGPEYFNNYTVECNKHDASHYYLGIYYNHTASVARNKISSEQVDSRVVFNTSICPSGWQLPAFEGQKSWNNLVEKGKLIPGSNGNVDLGPYYFGYFGFWNSKSQYIGSHADFWLNESYNKVNSYSAIFHPTDTTIRTIGLGGRNNGHSVRCLSPQ